MSALFLFLGFLQDPAWTERKLATIPFDTIARPSSTVYRADGSAVYWAGKSLKTDVSCVWTNQEPGEPFDNVQHLALSADDSTLAYMAFQRKMRFMVVGKRQDPAYEVITQAYLSADGRVCAYRVTKIDGEAMVVNGKEGRLFDKVHTPVFNPKTNVVAYVTALKERAPVMIGDREIAVHDQSYFPVWRPDGEELAYGARDGKESFVVVGGKRGKAYKSVSGPKYAPDGRTITYSAHNDDHSWIVVGEKEHGPFVNAFAYAVDRNLEVVAVAFGKKGENRVASEGWTSEDFDGIKSVSLDLQGRIQFEPVTTADGRLFAFRGERRGRWRILHGKEEGPEFAEIGSVVLSPSGRHVAYPGRSGDEVFMIVDGQRFGPYLHAGTPRFSPDERRLAFGAQVKTEFWWKVIEVSRPR